MKLKTVAAIESVVILILITGFIFVYVQKEELEGNIEKAVSGKGLLSKRIYAKILEPKTPLILNFSPLEKSLSQFFEDNQLNVTVYVLNLRDGASMGINEERFFQPMSLNKVSLAILILQKIERGELSFETKIPVRPEYRDKYDAQQIQEKELSVREALELMLQQSSNTAANMLGSYIVTEDIGSFLSYLNYYSKDSSVGEKSKPDLVNVDSIANIFSSLYFSTLLEPENSEYVIKLLTNTTFDLKKYAEIPENVTIAHKFGNRYEDNVKQFTDCGIIYMGRSRMFYCAITDDLDVEEAKSIIGIIVNRIYAYTVDIKAKYEDLEW